MDTVDPDVDTSSSLNVQLSEAEYLFLVLDLYVTATYWRVKYFEINPKWN